MGISRIGSGEPFDLRLASFLDFFAFQGLLINMPYPGITNYPKVRQVQFNIGTNYTFLGL
jgi:hypothetical protein